MFVLTLSSASGLLCVVQNQNKSTNLLHMGKVFRSWTLFGFGTGNLYYPCIYNVSLLHQDEEGIGKSIPAAQFPETQEISRGRSPREISRVEGNPRDFPRPWVLHHETRGISRGRSPREIPRVEGCKTHGQGKSRGRRGWISQYLPSLGGARTFSHHYQGRIAPLLQCRPLVVAFKLKLTPSSCYSIDDILSCFITQLS